MTQLIGIYIDGAEDSSCHTFVDKDWNTVKKVMFTICKGKKQLTYDEYHALGNVAKCFFCYRDEEESRFYQL
jgi:hypothetical protein